MGPVLWGGKGEGVQVGSPVYDAALGGGALARLLLERDGLGVAGFQVQRDEYDKWASEQGAGGSEWGTYLQHAEGGKAAERCTNLISRTRCWPGASAERARDGGQF